MVASKCSVSYTHLDVYKRQLEDCYEACKWAIEHKEELGINTDRLFVCGDSSGGNFAAAIVLMARDRKEFDVHGQILIYPVTDCAEEIKKKSLEVYGSVCGSKENPTPVLTAYFTDINSEASRPYASPLLVENLAGLPKALFIQAECDLSLIHISPAIMLVPMYILAALCLLTGIFYRPIAADFILPAVRSTVDVVKYIDVMMGEGYAAAAGVYNMAVSNVMVSSWSPIVYLILFVTVFIAAFIVILGSKSDRGATVEVDPKNAMKHSNFFSGEEAVYSHIGGSDMLWGYKYDFKPYYRVMEELHSGRVTDYCNMVAVSYTHLECRGA